MRRRVIQPAVFLLLGAIVNVAAAWGCALWSPMHSWVSIEADTIGLDLGPSAGWSHKYVAERVTAFGRVDLLADDPGIDDQPAMRFGTAAQQRSAGWPMLCLRGSITHKTQKDHLLLAPKFVERRMLEMRGMKIVGLQPWLPLALIWPGFAINTLFYAVILWLLFAAPFALQRRIRIRRGLCPACAYPIGDNQVCTECGKALHSRSTPISR